jgi:hypothetical protein
MAHGKSRIRDAADVHKRAAGKPLDFFGLSRTRNRGQAAAYSTLSIQLSVAPDVPARAALLSTPWTCPQDVRETRVHKLTQCANCSDKAHTEEIGYNVMLVFCNWTCARSTASLGQLVSCLSRWLPAVGRCTER